MVAVVCFFMFTGTRENPGGEGGQGGAGGEAAGQGGEGVQSDQTWGVS